MDSLVEKIRQGDVRAASRLISLVENHRPEGREAMKAVFRLTGRAFVVGITGPPGAGKSTLTDQLTSSYRQGRQTVGIVAVDPSSPFSGGAFLGDRVRMNRHGTDAGVFIRSMASRGTHGGVARTTAATVQILDALGRDVILVETLGVGQDEVAIAALSDLVLVVVQPSAGDKIQMMKAGMMEIGDLYVVNKADLPGASDTIREVRDMLHRSALPSRDVLPEDFADRRSFLTVARTGQGVQDLHAALEEIRRRFAAGSEGILTKRRLRLEENLRTLLTEEAGERIWKRLDESGKREEWVENLMNRSVDPYSCAEEILNRLLPS